MVQENIKIKYFKLFTIIYNNNIIAIQSSGARQAGVKLANNDSR